MKFQQQFEIHMFVPTFEAMSDVTLVLGPENHVKNLL